jgi:hypothetical protein
VGFQYIFFTINTVIGFAYWYRSYKRNKVVPRLRLEPGEDVVVRFLDGPPEVKLHDFLSPTHSIAREA